MKRPYGKRDAPFSLRLSFEERARLERNAGNMPVAAYIKSLLFAEDAPIYQTRGKAPVKDRQTLAEVLACLGATRLASNLNQLAHATNLGNFYFDHDTKAAIHAACDDVRVMRLLLMDALGLKTDDVKRPSGSVAQNFARAATPRKFTL
ncbi:MAG: hypothetical protein ACKVOP_04220 [Sphingomonadaceae bacterium]